MSNDVADQRNSRMEAAALLAELERRGIRVTLHPAGPTAAPPQLLTDRDLANLRRYKTDIVRLLRERTRRPQPPAQTKTLSPAESAQLIDDVAETFDTKGLSGSPPAPAATATGEPDQAREEDDAPLEADFAAESSETADDAAAPEAELSLEVDPDDVVRDYTEPLPAAEFNLMLETVPTKSGALATHLDISAPESTRFVVEELTRHVTLKHYLWFSARILDLSSGDFDKTYTPGINQPHRILRISIAPYRKE